MASAARQPQPPSLSPLHRPTPSPSATTPPDSRPGAISGLTSLADAGLKASPLKQAPALRALQSPALTGAAAMAEEERANEQKLQGSSPNPSFSPANVFLRDEHSAVSRPGDGPAYNHSPGNANASLSGGATTTSPLTAEPMQIDEHQQSPPSVLPSDTAQSKQTPQRTPNGDARFDERSHKAFTYPPRPDQLVDRNDATRHMSLPNSNSGKSPSNKKHKCPNCATEFTRHHNLKSHLLTHSHEKPFTCNNCNQKFRRLHDLKRHAKLHTGERPHVCEICNRKFARGDALARHSKGPGGCAGRRNSVGGEDDEGGASSFIDPSMDGVSYSQEDDVQQGDAKRRKSAPDHNRKRSLQVTNAVSPNSRQTSTYPPVAPMGRPDAQSDGNLQPPTHLSPRMVPTGTSQPGSSFSFAPSHMTESPGPLSPGSAQSRRLSAGLPQPRGRSPSLATSLAQQHISRGPGHASPPVNLPSAQIPHAPQLPSITGLDTRNRTSYPSPTSTTFGSSKASRPPPLISTHPPPLSTNGPSSGASPQSGSASSTHRSSGGSMREVLNNPPPPATGTSDDWLRDYIKKSEAEKQTLRDEFSAKQADYETQIAELRAEIASLRGHRPSVMPPPAAH